MKKYDLSRLNWLNDLVITNYTLIYVYFIENEDVKQVPRKIRHVIKFSATFCVYFVGNYFLGTIHVRWMQQLLHLVQIGRLSILIGMGIFDCLIFPLSKSVHKIIMGMKEFFIPPCSSFL